MLLLISVCLTQGYMAIFPKNILLKEECYGAKVALVKSR